MVTDIHIPQVGLGKGSMGGGPEAGQRCEPRRLRRVRRNEAGPEGGTVDMATGVVFGAQAAAGLTPSLRRVFAGWRANAHGPARTLTGVFSITVERKDDFDPKFVCDPGGFHWRIMDKRTNGLAGITSGSAIAVAKGSPCGAVRIDRVSPATPGGNPPKPPGGEPRNLWRCPGTLGYGTFDPKRRSSPNRQEVPHARPHPSQARA